MNSELWHAVRPDLSGPQLTRRRGDGSADTRVSEDDSQGAASQSMRLATKLVERAVVRVGGDQARAVGETTHGSTLARVCLAAKRLETACQRTTAPCR